MLSLWALFAGLGLLMLGNGLQGTLLGIRASLSGFSTSTTGAVMACYYVGYMLGSVITPPLIRRVGGIRVFAALASLVSFAPLAHVLFVNPVAWALLRVLALRFHLLRSLRPLHLRFLTSADLAHVSARAGQSRRGTALFVTSVARGESSNPRVPTSALTQTKQKMFYSPPAFPPCALR